MSNETEQTTDHDSRGDADGLEISLWVRRPVCGPRTTVIDRLSALRTAGDLDGFSVTTWPEEVALTGANREEELLATIEEFEDWAADRGLSLRPPFETRTASRLVGESEDVLRTPMLLAAAYEGDDLVGIYPCTDGTKTWTIPEFLDALEAGEERSPSGAGEHSVPSATEGTTS
ncbi:HTH domain-containing protein [Haloarcula salinisoli]|uniref:HTH domain-containing protein n=1 Tax=Haloarcula salinisoli TaxID=2487746 RepID=UPI001F1BE06B|nr:HTH domain-containing protein [Halomicroarcula salinisoli]